MAEPAILARWSALIAAMQRLGAARGEAEVVAILRSSARAIAASDGITVVKRDGYRVRYIAEDAIDPLWTGQDFPIESCISGIAMVKRETIVIPDILHDPRVPLNAYLSTFVRSMAMFPIGVGEPHFAIGAYWEQPGAIDPEAIGLLEALARTVGVVLDTIENIRVVTEHHERLRAGNGG